MEYFADIIYALHSQETDAEKLWLPPDSAFLFNRNWRSEHFPKTKRNNVALVTHNQNILSREGLLKVG